MSEYKLALKTLEAMFVISLLAQITAIWLSGKGTLTGEQWVSFTMFNIAAYGIADLGKQFIAARNQIGDKE